MADITHQHILDAITSVVETRLADTETRLTNTFRHELSGTEQRLTANLEEIIDGVTQQLDVISDNMVTKKDLRASEQRLIDMMATKEELQATELRLVATQHGIGQLNRQFSTLITGLAQAVDQNP